MTSDLDLAVKGVLDQHVPRRERAYGDWEDVLRRAEVVASAGTGTAQDVLEWPQPRSKRRFLHCRRVWVLAAAVLAAVAIVSSAFGWTSRLLDLVAGQPAPPRVKRAFALEKEARKRVLPIFRQEASGVVVAQAHGVIGLDSSVGPVILWAAPTRTGGVCWVVEIKRLDALAGRPTASANCSSRPPTADDPFDYSLSKTLVGDRYLELVMGRVLPEVSTVEVRDADESETLTIVEGFYLHELGTGSDPITLIALDRGGTEIRRQEIRRLEPIPRPDPVGPERVLIRFQTAAGFTLSFALARGENGSLCQMTRYRGSEGLTCGTRSTHACGARRDQRSSRPQERAAGRKAARYPERCCGLRRYDPGPRVHERHGRFDTAHRAVRPVRDPA